MDDLDLGQTLRGFSAGQKVFGRYVLTRMLGRGGMGVVWLAHDEKLGRDIALKFLPEVVAHDRDAIEDMKRETRRALELTHARIVRIYDFVQDDHCAAVSMEYVPGSTLTVLKHEQPGGVFSVATLEPWVKQLCEALEYAHADAQIAHRDLKPANLMLDAKGLLKITDFGISATLSDTATRASKAAGSSGTPVYMSPQQMMGEKTAATDDIYALGATLYELLTGKPPFYTGNILLQVQNKVPPTMAARRAELDVEAGEEIPASWEETIAACLSKDASNRPQTAKEVAERLLSGKVQGTGGEGALKKAEPARLQRRSDSEHVPATKQTTQSSVRMSAPAESSPSSRSRQPLWPVWVAVAVMALGLGWYFGIKVPEDKRQEALAQQEAETAAQAAKAAAARARAEQERITAELAAKAKAEEVKQAAETKRLEAARGGLIVSTSPAGATVKVGGVGLKTSPATFEQLRLGTYVVVVDKSGYASTSLSLDVAENRFTEPPTVALTPLVGSARLESKPEGLTYRIESSELVAKELPKQNRTGKTPALEDHLPVGTYQVTVMKDGWPAKSAEVTIKSGEDGLVQADFAPGTLSIASSPSGASVLLKGTVVGVTPLVLHDLLPGSTSLELRLKGYRSKTISGVLEPGQELRLEASLQPYEGPREGQAWRISSPGIELLPIPTGEFQMGSQTGEVLEKPVMQVVISKPFWLGRTEVTQAQYQAVMGTNPAEDIGPDLPAERMTWNDAMAFCRKLTEQEGAAGRLPEGYAYSLPTEAQWEYACRAGSTGDYAGNLDDMGWYEGNAHKRLHVVATKQPNAFGLYDMHGNVEEYCFDWVAPYPGGRVMDYEGPESGRFRAIRSGRMWNSARFSRSARRGGLLPTAHNYALGFRLALVPLHSVGLSDQPAPRLAAAVDPTNPQQTDTNAYAMKDLDQQPVMTQRAVPVYPFEMKKAHIEGRVLLRFIVNVNGDVQDVSVVSSSQSEFEPSAINAVMKWKFTPGRKGGRAVNSLVMVPIQFNLNDE